MPWFIYDQTFKMQFQILHHESYEQRIINLGSYGDFDLFPNALVVATMMIQFRALSYFVDMAPRLFHKIEVLTFQKMYGGTCHPKWYQQPPWLMDYTWLSNKLHDPHSLLFDIYIYTCDQHLFEWIQRDVSEIKTVISVEGNVCN